MFLMKIGCPRYMVQNYFSKNNEKELTMNLDLLEETQLMTLVYKKIYKQKTTQYNDHKVRNKCFYVGELSSLEKTRGNRKP
jgi:hypothetical protein